MSRVAFTSTTNVTSQTRCVDIGGRRTQASKGIHKGRRVTAIEGEREVFRWVKLQQASVDNAENHILELTANKRHREKQIFGRQTGKDLYQELCNLSAYSLVRSQQKLLHWEEQRG